METGSNLVQVIQSHQTTMINSTNPVHHPNNPPGPLQTPTSNLVVMATNVIDNSKQIINNLAREMMESTGLHTTTTSSILAQSTITNTNLIVKQESVTRSMFFLLIYIVVRCYLDIMIIHTIKER